MMIRTIRKKQHKRFVDAEFKSFFSDFFGKEGKDYYRTYSSKGKSVLLAAMDKGKMVGAVSVSIDRSIARVGAFAVAKGFTRKGVGSMLLKRCERMAKKAKCRKIWLFTLPGIPAYSFYLKNGYHEEARLRKHWGGKKDLCVMSKFI